MKIPSQKVFQHRFRVIVGDKCPDSLLCSGKRGGGRVNSSVDLRQIFLSGHVIRDSEDDHMLCVSVGDLGGGEGAIVVTDGKEHVGDAGFFMWNDVGLKDLKDLVNIYHRRWHSNLELQDVLAAVWNLEKTSKGWERGGEVEDIVRD